MRLSCLVTEIRGLKDFEVTTLTFRSHVSHRLREHGLAVVTLLLVVNDDDASILHRYGDTCIKLQSYV